LPIGQYSWLTEPEIREITLKLPKLSSTGEYGYYFEVDLFFPDNIHNLLCWFPLAPEKKFYSDECLSPYMQRLQAKFNIKRGKIKKSVSSLDPKKNYRIHFRLLQFYIGLGVQITKVHKIMRFRQAPFMKPFIVDTICQRQNSRNSFEKTFYKLIANSTYGNCCRNKRKERNMKLITNMDQARKANRNPLFKCFSIYEEDFVTVELGKKRLYMDRPIQVAASILDISKLLMFKFYYETMKGIYPKPNQLKLCYQDTDAQALIIQTEDLYVDLALNKQHFDFSNYPETHPCYDNSNKMRLYCMKDEAAGKVISECVFLRPKVYSIKIHEAENKKKAKGLPKRLVKTFRHNDYKKALFQKSRKEEQFYRIHSKFHKVYLRKELRVGISAFSDKRYYLGRYGVFSYPYGHKNIKKLESKKTA
jgi:hypothetical protein